MLQPGAGGLEDGLHVVERRTLVDRGIVGLGTQVPRYSTYGLVLHAAGNKLHVRCATDAA